MRDDKPTSRETETCMPSFGSPEGDVAYLIVCAAPPAREAADTVGLLGAAGWRVCVVATPAALAWIDAAALATTTGHPVRSDFRGPDDPEFAPRGDAVLVAPASFNTVNKWAAGINDTLALGLVNEALGLAYPAGGAGAVGERHALAPPGVRGEPRPPDAGRRAHRAPGHARAERLPRRGGPRDRAACAHPDRRLSSLTADIRGERRQTGLSGRRPPRRRRRRARPRRTRRSRRRPGRPRATAPGG